VTHANKYALKGTILEEYRSLATKLLDIDALATAVQDVCKEAVRTRLVAADKDGNGKLTKDEVKKYLKANPEIKTLLLGKDDTWQAFFEGMDTDGDGSYDLVEFVNKFTNARSSRTNYAAVHLRIGDVMGVQRYMFTKFVPAEMYEVAAAALVDAGVTAVDLFYQPIWGVGGKYRDSKERKTEKYIEAITTTFKNAGILTVEKAPNANADQDVCAMMEAPYFVVAGGGYSRLIRDLRAHIGDTLSPSIEWWCTWSHFDKTSTPYSQTLQNMYQLAVKHCPPFSGVRKKINYWNRLAWQQANNNNSYNWAEIEENLDKTEFDSTHISAFDKRHTGSRLANLPIDKYGKAFVNESGPYWDAAMCCQFHDVSTSRSGTCAVCVNQDHYCSLNRWRCETHCQMQLCESGSISAHPTKDFPGLELTIKRNKQKAPVNTPPH
jgi:Ca2+-binding EF-hand superfamily protein